MEAVLPKQFICSCDSFTCIIPAINVDILYNFVKMARTICLVASTELQIMKPPRVQTNTTNSLKEYLLNKCMFNETPKC